MGSRIHKSIGYGVLFPNYEDYLSAVTEDFRKLYEDFNKEGVPFSKLLESSLKKGSSDDTFIMNHLLDSESRMSKVSLKDVIDIVSYTATPDSEMAVGVLIRPLQSVNNVDGQWKRIDDVLDYYSSPSGNNSWEESDYSFYPYEACGRVNRFTGEKIDVTSSEYVAAKKGRINLDKVKDWQVSVPETPKNVLELVEALNIFVDKNIVLVPVIAVWWE